MGRTHQLTAGTRRRPAGSLRAKSTCCSIVAGTIAAVVAGPSPWVIAAALGLGYAAVSDWLDRRVPRTSIRVAAIAVSALILATSWGSGEWLVAVRGATAGGIALAVLGWLWWVAPSALGFGDVKAVALATAAAAASSWRALACVLLATVVAAQAVVLAVALTRRTQARSTMTVPFVPALCAGFVVGMWTA